MPLITHSVSDHLIVSSPRQLTLDLVKPPQPSLDNFVVGRNAEVVAALRAIAGGSGEQFVYLWGDDRRGTLPPAESARPGYSAARSSGLDTQTGAYTPSTTSKACANSQQQRLFVLLNEIRAAGTARFVAAGNAAPMHLALRDDVRTRLAWGLVYQVHALSDEEKAHALSAHATSRGLRLPADVIEYLLTHMPRDMRTLVAVVDALDTYALSVKKPLTVPLVRQWADDTAPEGRHRKIRRCVRRHCPKCD